MNNLSHAIGTSCTQHHMIIVFPDLFKACRFFMRKADCLGTRYSWNKMSNPCCDGPRFDPQSHNSRDLYICID